MQSYTYRLIREALTNKQQVIARYNRRWRELCPHALGTKNGWEYALFVQFGGNSLSHLSVSPLFPRWLCTKVADLSDVRLRDGPWHTMSFTEGCACFDKVDITLLGQQK